MNGADIDKVGSSRKAAWGFMFNFTAAVFAPVLNIARSIGNRCVIHPFARIKGDVMIGKGAIVADCVIFAYGGKVEIGEGSEIYGDCRIYAHADVKIGRDVILARESAIMTTKHIFDDPEKTIKEQGQTYEGVVIEDDVWLGYRAVVLPGAKIGRGSVIGAGAVVSGDVPPMSIAVGVPARVIRKRGESKA
jgi:acetyltransferase-like isoleucine patch superfamily enzyme